MSLSNDEVNPSSGRQLDVILSADPLLQPETGIGTYTRKLGLELLDQERVRALHLYANGVFLSQNSLNSSYNHGTTPQPYSGGLLHWVRGKLVKSSYAMSMYPRVMPFVDRLRLRHHGNRIFHATNFILPMFHGRKVVTFHDLSTVRYPQCHPVERVKLIEAAMASSAERADHIITDSELVRREVIEYYGVAKTRVTAIHLAAGAEYRPRNALECASTLDKYKLNFKRFFLFVSTIEPRKNILRICKAYRDFRGQTGCDWPFVFVGNQGWNSADEHAAIRDLELKGWAKYLKYVDHNALTHLFSAAATLVFPSLYEGFGLPALEAKRSKTPVLTSSGSSMEEFIGLNDTAVDPLDTKAIANYMKSTWRAAEALAVSSDGIEPQNELPDDSLTWRNTARQTLAVYDRLPS